MAPVEAYLAELQRIRATGAGTDETSYYGPLASLLNTVGEELRPRVHCVMQIRQQGAGLPDGGLFSDEQVSAVDQSLDGGAIPSRGVIEVKPPSRELDRVIEGEQIDRYINRYGLVLVTNYRDFLLSSTSTMEPIACWTACSLYLAT